MAQKSWLCVLIKSIRIKYSKSGAVLPIINAELDSFFDLVKGSTMAGWQNVKGIIRRLKVIVLPIPFL